MHTVGLLTETWLRSDKWREYNFTDGQFYSVCPTTWRLDHDQITMTSLHSMLFSGALQMLPVL